MVSKLKQVGDGDDKKIINLLISVFIRVYEFYYNSISNISPHILFISLLNEEKMIAVLTLNLKASHKGPESFVHKVDFYLLLLSLQKSHIFSPSDLDNRLLSHLSAWPMSCPTCSKRAPPLPNTPLPAPPRCQTLRLSHRRKGVASQIHVQYGQSFSTDVLSFCRRPQPTSWWCFQRAEIPNAPIFCSLSVQPSPEWTLHEEEDWMWPTGWSLTKSDSKAR